ncbi:hypothetical protein QBC44DRAFT_397908 [Cladorrhinum sp. PSN332]|nr:hypothetical protein QBC44DRAFT_397908 [Cladorrhinum sp. PSN332]
MKTTNFLATIAVLFATAQGMATPARRLDGASSPVPEGYGIVELEWEIETTAGGPKATFTGTVEEVHAQLLEINPNWDEEVAATLLAERDAATAALEARAIGDGENGLQKRDWTICGNDLGARQDRIREGISYLRGLSGQAVNGPGPRNCSRVSCSWNSGIWYCNNNSFNKAMPWFHIANAAQVLVDQCSWHGGAWGILTRGERWHDDQWFAIVASSTC